MEVLFVQLGLYQNYHSQKETMTWTALGLYVAFVGAGVSLSLASDLPPRGMALVSVAALGVWTLSVLFVGEQLRCKAFASDAFDAITSLIYGVLGGSVLVDGDDFRFADDQFQPAILVREMARQHDRRRTKRGLAACVWLAVTFRYSRLESQERIELLVFATLHLGMVLVLLSLWSRMLGLDG